MAVTPAKRFTLERVGAAPGGAVFVCENLIGETAEVVGAGDYDALARELYDSENLVTGEWFNRVTYKRQMREAQERVQKLEAALAHEIDVLQNYDAGSTHYDGCEKVHPRCAALKRMKDALALPL